MLSDVGNDTVTPFTSSAGCLNCCSGNDQARYCTGKEETPKKSSALSVSSMERVFCAPFRRYPCLVSAAIIPRIDLLSETLIPLTISRRVGELPYLRR